MNLPKAIELMEVDVQDPGEIPIDDYVSSAKLLIEAGKLLIRERELLNDPKHSLLPGETL